MKRDKYDTVFSDCIREAAGWVCERCHKLDVDGQVNGKSLRTHCSHIYGRRNKATRWFPDNACCLCAACHKDMGDSPIEHAAFARSVLGDVRFEQLGVMAHSVYKWTKAEKHEMYLHYKRELERIKIQKMAGESIDPLVSYQ